MGYSPEHKQKTRKRIVEAARRLWKAKGYANVTVAEIMKAAGLTHGGFYAHFKSKEELFAAAALDAGVMERYAAYRDDPGADPIEVFEAVLETYLSAGHRDHPEEGCSLVALSDDARRLGADVQSVYTHLTKRAVRLLSDLLQGDEALAHTVLAAMVGAIQLARAVDDPKLSQAFLDDAKAQFLKVVWERKK